MNNEQQSVIHKSMSPWFPERDPVIQRRIGKTGEECAELLKVIHRIAIQGIDGVDPETSKPNRVALQEELADVMIQAQLCVEFFGFDPVEIAKRCAKKRAWMAEWEALVKGK